MSFVPVKFAVTDSTIWWEAVAVYKSGDIGVQLRELAGGSVLTSGTIPGGTYTKDSFALALKTLLDYISANDYVYEVISNEISYTQMPQQPPPIPDPPLRFGSSFTVSNNLGAGFTIVIA